jgi:hypothetical protein
MAPVKATAISKKDMVTLIVCIFQTAAIVHNQIIPGNPGTAGPSQ